ncbi:MAG TPA: MaoC/PaaZ C-terminal domain-containing protein [Acidimicrobiales bacterium]|nr:MaoC/PaaZ C-terminal domain-containing protein [Acidimicrobiales bacterium]
MPINPNAATGEWSEWSERSWTSKDALLYAVGVGAGVTDPTGHELEFTTENSSGVTQQVLPTFAVIIGGAMGGMRDIGTFNPAMLVDGGRTLVLHRPIPVDGKIRSRGRVVGVYDKGSGAVVATESESVDAATGEPLFNLNGNIFLRGEGGFGGDRGPSGPRNVPPDRKPDHEVTYETRADQALIYRLSGDRNPLHSDPEFAKMAGFPKPILHGLCTYGFTGRALLHALCGSDPARFRSMEGRFSKPVFPGEALTVKMWVDGDSAVFTTESSSGAVVIDQGACTFATE